MFQRNNNVSFIFIQFVCIITSFTIKKVISTPCNTCLVFKRFRIRRKRITWFISVIIPQTSCCFSVIFVVSNKLYIGITTSRSSALSIYTPLIFEMQLISGVFLNATTLFLFALSRLMTPIIPFTTIYASLKSHKSDLNIGVLILISLLKLQFLSD